MTQAENHVDELIPAYALDALDPAERSRVEAHLASCADCRARAAEYGALSRDLSLALPPKPPPARVRAQLAARLARSRPAPAKRPPRWRLSLAQLAAGVLLLVLAGVNGALFVELQRVQRQQAALTQQLARNQQALAVLAQPDARLLPVTGPEAGGSVIVSAATNTAVLSVSGLPALDETQDYQLWLIPPEGAPVGVLTFRSQPGEPVLLVPIMPDQPLDNFAAIGVTIEPAGGSPSPTGQLVLQATL